MIYRKFYLNLFIVSFIGFSSSCYAQEDALTDFLGKAKDIIVDHVKKDYKRNPELYHDLAREGIKKVGEGIKNTWNYFTEDSADDLYNKGLKHYKAKEYAEALKYYKLAADKGHTEAMNNLGYAYLEGEGVSKNDIKAAEYFKLGAEKGNSNSQYFLGGLYYDGTGVKQSYIEAEKYLRLSANQGNPLGLSGLGLLYEEGHGVSQDYFEAAKYYKLAADEYYKLGLYESYEFEKEKLEKLKSKLK